MHWLALFFAVIANVLSNVALKVAVQTVPTTLTLHTLRMLIAEKWFWIGVIAAGVLLAAYLYAIRGIPLSLAYPIVTGMAMVGIALASALALAEPINVAKAVGIGMIIAGTGILSQGQ